MAEPGDLPRPPDRDLAKPSSSPDFAGVDPVVACPETLPSPSGPCAGGLFCAYETPCKGTCSCETGFPFPNASQPGQWRCTVEVGAGCGEAFCPAVAPLPVDGMPPSCTKALVANTCDYPGQPADCTSSCRCQLEEVWRCQTTCACPSQAPKEGEACGKNWQFLTCAYPGSTCSCVAATDTSPTAWDCSVSGCPMKPPVNGAACDRALDANFCPYDQEPYCGHCFCRDDGKWDCSPSTCDKCPDSPPTPTSSCEGLANQNCQWLVTGTVGLGHTTYCTCLPGAFHPEEWTCHDV